MWFLLQATQVLSTGQEREFQVVYRNKNPRKGRHDIVVSLKEIEVSNSHFFISALWRLTLRASCSHDWLQGWHLAIRLDRSVARGISCYKDVGARAWGLNKVSGMRLQKELCWKRVQQLAEEKVSIASKVDGSNGGGVFADIEGIRGFCPGSHIPQASLLGSLPPQSSPCQSMLYDLQEPALRESLHPQGTELQNCGFCGNKGPSTRLCGCMRSAWVA